MIESRQYLIELLDQNLFITLSARMKAIELDRTTTTLNTKQT